MTLAALKLFLADPFAGNVRTLRSETIPRILDAWNRLPQTRGRPASPLRFKDMAGALKLPAVPTVLGEQLFDDPDGTKLLLTVEPEDGPSGLSIETLMERIMAGGAARWRPGPAQSSAGWSVAGQGAEARLPARKGA